MASKKAKIENDSTTDAKSDDASVMEWWWRFQPQIADQPLACDGIRKRRVELERIVKPHLARRATKDAVLFKGKRRYVDAKSLEAGRENRLAWAAILALQCLYNLEKAIESEDINAVIQWTYAFTRCDFDVAVIQRSGWEAWSAAALWNLDQMADRTRREKQAQGPKSRTGQNKLSPHDELIKTLHIKHHGKHNFMQLIRRDLGDKEIPVSDDTLRKRLKHLKLSR